MISLLPLLAASLLTTTDAGVPTAVADALQAAAPANTRVNVLSYRGPNSPCAPTSARVSRPVHRSGQVAVLIQGEGCSATTWANVQLFAPTLVTTQKVPQGSPLNARVMLAEREVTSVTPPLTQLPDGAVASSDLPAGTVLLPSALGHPGPKPGQMVQVVLSHGGISITQEGRAISCGPDQACAVLSNGKRVDGAWIDGHIVWEVP